MFWYRYFWFTHIFHHNLFSLPVFTCHGVLVFLKNKECIIQTPFSEFNLLDHLTVDQRKIRIYLHSFLWYLPWKISGFLFLLSLAFLVIPYLIPRIDVVYFVQYSGNSDSSLEKHSSCTLQCSCRKHGGVYINCAMDVMQDSDYLLVIYMCKNCSQCTHCGCISMYILKKERLNNISYMHL